MRVESSNPSELLAELQTLLACDQLPTQEKTARAAGVHQSLVSRARNGQLKRITDKVGKLLEYARSCAGAEKSAAAAARAIDAETIVPIEVQEAAGDSKALDARRLARRRGGASADVYQRQARDGVETYLNEGFDPRLIVEQLAVLRRAQRLRRPGPLPPGASDDHGV